MWLPSYPSVVCSWGGGEEGGEVKNWKYRGKGEWMGGVYSDRLVRIYSVTVLLSLLLFCNNYNRMSKLALDCLKVSKDWESKHWFNCFQNRRINSQMLKNMQEFSHALSLFCGMWELLFLDGSTYPSYTCHSVTHQSRTRQSFSGMHGTTYFFGNVHIFFRMFTGLHEKSFTFTMQCALKG